LNLAKLSLDSTPPADYEPAGTLRWDANLTDMADFFGSDKGTLKHNYTPVYETHLAKLKSEPINLLEIGVACGASLKMWSRYFPYGRITGVDIRPECAELCKGYPNIDIKIADATKETFIGEWDVILDDGSHLPGHIARTFHLQWPWLKSGGLYIVEDLRCTYNPAYRVSFPAAEEDRDRSKFMGLVDALLRRMDSGGDVVRVEFSRELMIVEKR
jgi:hypothetical protein